LGIALWQVPERRETKGLDLSLRDFAFEPADLGGGYGRYAFPARSRGMDEAGSGKTPWRNGGRTAVDERALLLPYAGIGLGPFKLSMDLDDLDVWLAKDKSSRRSRAFAGIGYTPLPDLNLNLEYRALAAGEPLFALDLGNLSLDIDTPFEIQTVALTVNYRF
jgi:opacity protein-like surface antigen